MVAHGETVGCQPQAVQATERGDRDILTPVPLCDGSGATVSIWLRRIRQSAMNKLKDVLQLRVRYSETDQMGTFYNSRALEWFECGRTELMRNRLRMSYAALEKKGVFLPLVEAHLEFQGGARYDDLLSITSTAELQGRARLRFNVEIAHSETGRPVVRGYTIHAFTDTQGKPTRPPEWFVTLLGKAA
jgi:acyl-CoA thioester hydrolase